MIKIILLILLSELWGTCGQVFYKKSVMKLEVPNLRKAASYMKFLKSVILMPTIWIGLVFIGIGLAVWLTALAQADLSLVFPVDSMQYIITLAAAHVFLGEKINKLKVVGTSLIVGGIMLVAMS